MPVFGFLTSVPNYLIPTEQVGNFCVEAATMFQTKSSVDFCEHQTMSLLGLTYEQLIYTVRSYLFITLLL